MPVGSGVYTLQHKKDKSISWVHNVFTQNDTRVFQQLQQCRPDSLEKGTLTLNCNLCPSTFAPKVQFIWQERALRIMLKHSKLSWWWHRWTRCASSQVAHAQTQVWVRNMDMKNNHIIIMHITPPCIIKKSRNVRGPWPKSHQSSHKNSSKVMFSLLLFTLLRPHQWCNPCSGPVVARAMWKQACEPLGRRDNSALAEYTATGPRVTAP